MRISHRHFTRGFISDGDSTDLEGDALSACVNLDIVDTIGECRARWGLAAHTFAFPSSIGTQSNLALWKWVRWDSGVGAVQHNSLLVFRRYNYATDTWGDGYALFTNAPYGGDAGALNRWWGLTQAGNAEYTGGAADIYDATDCNVAIEEGQVYVAFGRSSAGVPLDYFVLKDMVDDQLYPTGRQLPLDLIDGATIWTRSYGAGGRVRNGWLWDYAKPYVKDVMGEITFAFSTTVSGVALPPGDYSLAVVVVYDETQYGLGKVATFYKGAWGIASSPLQGVSVTWSITHATYSPRITGFAIYAMGRNIDGRADDTDYVRITTLPFDNTLTTYTYTMRWADYMKSEGTWASDSKGRPMTFPDFTEATLAFGVVLTKTWTPDDGCVDKYISVKPRGLMVRRKRMYAWGIADDSGQTRIAVSTQDDIRGAQLDIFYYINRIYREGSQATTALLEWRDRALLFNRHNLFWIDLEQRVQDTYQTPSAGYGIGTAYHRTIVRTERGVFFANDDGIYKFSSSIEDLTYRRIKEEWRRIPSAYKQNAAGGYNPKRDEYWISVRTAGAGASDRVYTVYVWHDDPMAQNWRIYRFDQAGTTTDAPTAYRMDGLIVNNDFELVLYGTAASYVPQFRALTQDATDAGTAIKFLLRSQWYGVRADESVLHTLNLERRLTENADAIGDYTMYVDIYGNREEGTPYATYAFPNTRRLAAPMRRMRVNQYQFAVRGSWSATTDTIPPAIYEITLDSADTRKRRA